MKCCWIEGEGMHVNVFAEDSADPTCLAGYYILHLTPSHAVSFVAEVGVETSPVLSGTAVPWVVSQ